MFNGSLIIISMVLKYKIEAWLMFKFVIFTTLLLFIYKELFSGIAITGATEAVALVCNILLEVNSTVINL